MPEQRPLRTQGVDRVKDAPPVDGEVDVLAPDIPTPTAAAASSPNLYGDLARRIAGWTSNVLAMAIVLVLILGAGHYVLDWAGRETAEDARTSNPDSSPTVDGGRPLEAQFPVAGLQREPWLGNRESIRQQLRQRVQQQAEELIASSGGLAQARERQPAGPEQKLLELTTGRAPQAIAPGQWEVHEFIGAFPLAVSFVHLKPVAESSRGATTGSASPQASNRRMAAWAMAVPAGGKDSWSVYLQTKWEQPAGGQAMLGIAGAPPLPPGTQPTLALTTAGGGRQMGFAGEVSAADCREHFNRWGAAQSPPITLAWSNSGKVWHVQIPPRGLQPAALHIQLATDARGHVVGLITLLPPTTHTPSSEEP